MAGKGKPRTGKIPGGRQVVFTPAKGLKVKGGKKNVATFAPAAGLRRKLGARRRRAPIGRGRRGK